MHFGLFIGGEPVMDPSVYDAWYADAATLDLSQLEAARAKTREEEQNTGDPPEAVTAPPDPRGGE